MPRVSQSAPLVGSQFLSPPPPTRPEQDPRTPSGWTTPNHVYLTPSATRSPTCCVTFTATPWLFEFHSRPSPLPRTKHKVCPPVEVDMIGHDLKPPPPPTSFRRSLSALTPPVALPYFSLALVRRFFRGRRGCLVKHLSLVTSAPSDFPFTHRLHCTALRPLVGRSPAHNRS